MDQGRRRGVFITFEGADGTGKTTQFELVSERFRNQGVAHVSLREPGSTEAGERLRQLLLHSPEVRVAPETEVLLYAASRAQLIREQIVPALQSGLHVLCDRYVDSSLAYQGFGLGVSLDFVRAVNRVAWEEAVPDLTVLFKLPAGVRYGPADDNDRVELRESAFHERVRQGYLELAAGEPDRFVVVEATEGANSIQTQVWDVVRAQLGS